MMARGYMICSGGTDNHLFLIDLIDKDATGIDAENALGAVHITVNKIAVPNDPRSPFVSSCVRIGTPAITTRGFKQVESRELAAWICEVLANLDDQATLERVRSQVADVTRRFPVYQK